MKLKKNKEMKLDVILYFVTIVLMFSCQNQNDKKASNLKEYNIELDGKKYHFFEDDQGVKTGPFSIEYFNKEISSGFLRHGQRDSVYELFWKSGKLKMKTYYINGKENGCNYTYSELGNEAESYFMENDTQKTKSALYYLIKNSKVELGFLKKSYFLKDSIWIYSGSLVLDTNLNVLQYDSVYGKKSTFYNIETKRDSNGLIIPLNMNHIRLRFFRLEDNSIFNVKIGESTILTQANKYLKQYQIDSSGIFKYIINPKIQGWHFVRGEFEETISDGQKRTVPIYFNYYVP
jgi:hypothetical protein